MRDHIVGFVVALVLQVTTLKQHILFHTFGCSQHLHISLLFDDNHTFGDVHTFPARRHLIYLHCRKRKSETLLPGSPSLHSHLTAHTISCFRQHNVHHLTVATPEDFTSAPKGMTIYQFIPQYLTGSLKSVSQCGDERVWEWKCRYAPHDDSCA